MGALTDMVYDVTGRVMASDSGQRFIVWLEKLSPKDRQALKLLSGFLAVVLVVALVLYPPLNYSADARAQLREQQNLLAWMKGNEDRARAAAPAAAATRSQPLQAFVSSTATQSGFSFRRIEPSGEDGLRVWIDNVPFDALLSWLDQLVEQAVMIDDVSLERSVAPGLVNVRLGLSG